METLPLLPDHTFTRVLCVVAHPDDMEYGMSAAVAAWTARGVEVAYLLLTHGEAGMSTLAPALTGPMRAAEQRAACDVVGVRDLEMLDHPDGVLVYGLELRRSIARAIRARRPDVVVTAAWDVEMPWGLNQADHRAAGLACLDAVRDADNPWVFADLLEEGLQPWGARWLLVAGDPRATHGVDVTGEPLARGVRSLEAHAQYLAAIPGHPVPAEFIPAMTQAGGEALGVEHGVLVRAYDLKPFASGE
jgi:LmbE family N-acetylglucosaminyl deacetylase